MSSLGDLLLTQAQKYKFSGYKTDLRDSSLSSRLFSPLWDLLATYIPASVAPNMISLASVVVVVQAWYVVYHYGASFSSATTVFAGIMVLSFYVLDAVDHRHAANIQNDSSLTELFDHACSSIASIFVALTLCFVFEITDTRTVHLIVQLLLLALFNKHAGALVREKMSYRLLGGPGEVVFLTLCVLGIKLLVGIPTLENGADFAAQILRNKGLGDFEFLEDSKSSFAFALSSFGCVWAYSVFIRVAGTRSPYLTQQTKSSLLLCLLHWALPVLAFTFINPYYGVTVLDIVANGLATSVVTFDVVLCRMSSSADAVRSVHPYVVLITMLGVLSSFASLLFVPLYMLTVLFELSSFTDIPLMSVNVNVYVDGIYDLCHVGHMKAFENAKKFGTRLYVGVVDDEIATTYKRPPIMTAKEREEVVARCKHVFKTIPHAPCVKGTLDRDFVRKHSIHIVVHGEEYDQPDDEWYAVPRALGMTRVIPRTDGISTSDLIGRISKRLKAGEDVKAASD